MFASTFQLKLMAVPLLYGSIYSIPLNVFITGIKLPLKRSENIYLSSIGTNESTPFFVGNFSL